MNEALVFVEEDSTSAFCEQENIFLRSGSTGWRPPPLAWILEMGSSHGYRLPGRILCAGTGAEPLLLAAGLPEVSVHVVEHQIDLIDWTLSQKKERCLKNLEIHKMWAGSRGLTELVGGRFDLILCPDLFWSSADHGKIFARLSSALHHDHGILYFQAPGESNPIKRLTHIEEDVLKILQHPACSSLARAASLANLSGLLPGDADQEALHAAVTRLGKQCHPLAHWLALGKGENLHFRAFSQANYPLSCTLNRVDKIFWSELDVIKIAMLEESIAPAPVHDLVFTRRPAPIPPWKHSGLLEEWRPATPFFDGSRLPAMSPPWDNSLEARVEIPGVLPPTVLRISSLLLELLRRAGQHSVSLQEHLSAIDPSLDPAHLPAALSFLHHQGLMRLYPPPGLY
jgi:hypothetical protein